MSRINYYFDTESSQYKRVKTRTSDFIINALGITILSTGIAIVLVIIYTFNVESPRESKLRHKVKEMEFYYTELNKKVESLKNEFTSIEKRDDNIYRVVLGAGPLDPAIRQGGVEGYDPYRDLREVNSSNAEFIAGLHEKVDKLRRKLYIESLSQDDVVRLTLNKENLYAAIPAIQPVSNKQLIAIASGFGLRIHPVYKVIRMHTGIDFAAPIGTTVHATADGRVTAVDVKFDGYGKMLTIDHGFGYITRYAHLQDFLVKVGQKVKRGEPIGYVGNTGLSTASHLHYEVLINGEQIDPVHYFFNDLNPVEYEKVVELASVKNQSLGN